MSNSQKTIAKIYKDIKIVDLKNLAVRQGVHHHARESGDYFNFGRRL